jgi:hypothetical protein
MDASYRKEALARVNGKYPCVFLCGVMSDLLVRWHGQSVDFESFR